MKDIVEWLDKEAELVALDRLSEAADVIRRLSAAVDAKIIEAGEMRLEIERLRSERDDWYMRALKAEAALEPKP